MIVIVFGASGLLNTYTSVLSIVGSSVMSGASRWDEDNISDGTSRSAAKKSLSGFGCIHISLSFRIGGVRSSVRTPPLHSRNQRYGSVCKKNRSEIAQLSVAPASLLYEACS